MRFKLSNRDQRKSSEASCTCTMPHSSAAAKTTSCCLHLSNSASSLRSICWRGTRDLTCLRAINSIQAGGRPAKRLILRKACRLWSISSSTGRLIRRKDAWRNIMDSHKVLRRSLWSASHINRLMCATTDHWSILRRCWLTKIQQVCQGAKNDGVRGEWW